MRNPTKQSSFRVSFSAARFLAVGAGAHVQAASAQSIPKHDLYSSICCHIWSAIYCLPLIFESIAGSLWDGISRLNSRIGSFIESLADMRSILMLLSLACYSGLNGRPLGPWRGLHIPPSLARDLKSHPASCGSRITGTSRSRDRYGLRRRVIGVRVRSEGCADPFGGKGEGGRGTSTLGAMELS